MPSRLLQRRHIEALVAVGDTASVHGASRALGMPQPALSRLLSEAESLLGARLFERSSQGSKPTLQGEAVLAQARFVLRGIERLGAATAGARPAIQLGCIALCMHTLMPQLLERVYPHVADEGRNALRFRLVEGSSTMLMDAVVRGSLDFALLRSVGGALGDRDVTIEHLYDEGTVVVCAADNASAPAGLVDLAQLADQDWVLPEPETASRAAFDRFWSADGSPPIRPRIEARSFETNLALVARSRFLSIAPESIARRHVLFGEVRIVRIRQTLPVSPIALALRPIAREDPLLEAFRTLILELAQRVRATSNPDAAQASTSRPALRARKAGNGCESRRR